MVYLMLVSLNTVLVSGNCPSLLKNNDDSGKIFKDFLIIYNGNARNFFGSTFE